MNQIIRQNRGPNGTSKAYAYITAVITTQKTVANQDIIPFDSIITSSNITYTNNNGTIFNIPASGPYAINFFVHSNTVDTTPPASGVVRIVLENNGTEILTISNQTALVVPSLNNQSFPIAKADIVLPLTAGTVTLQNALNIPVTLGSSPTAVGLGVEFGVYLSMTSLFKPQ